MSLCQSNLGAWCYMWQYNELIWLRWCHSTGHSKTNDSASITPDYNQAFFKIYFIFKNELQCSIGTDDTNRCKNLCRSWLCPVEWIPQILIKEAGWFIQWVMSMICLYGRCSWPSFLQLWCSFLSSWKLKSRGMSSEVVHPTVCKKKIFRNLIEDYSIYSYSKIKIVLEYRYASGIFV